MIADDDVAVERSTYSTGRRGVAGTLIIENVIIIGQDIVMLLTMDPAHGTFHLFWPDNGVNFVCR